MCDVYSPDLCLLQLSYRELPIELRITRRSQEMSFRQFGLHLTPVFCDISSR
jgi:hypothetical protein